MTKHLRSSKPNPNTAAWCGAVDDNEILGLLRFEAQAESNRGQCCPRCLAGLEIIYAALARFPAAPTLRFACVVIGAARRGRKVHAVEYNAAGGLVTGKAACGRSATGETVGWSYDDGVTCLACRQAVRARQELVNDAWDERSKHSMDRSVKWIFAQRRGGGDWAIRHLGFTAGCPGWNNNRMLEETQIGDMRESEFGIFRNVAGWWKRAPRKYLDCRKAAGAGDQ